MLSTANRFDVEIDESLSASNPMNDPVITNEDGGATIPFQNGEFERAIRRVSKLTLRH